MNNVKKIWNSGIAGKFAVGVVIFLISCCCFATGLVAITPNSNSAPLVSETKSEATQGAIFIPQVTATPFSIPINTTTPDPFQDIRARFINPDLMLYDEYSSIDVSLDGDVLKINIIRKEGDFWGYESLQDISSFLHLALVDCTTYRFGHGIDGCKIKETAPYEYVELREFLPSGELKAYVRFTVGNKEYFSGFDGTHIIENDIFEIADESSLQP
jgi:hypothetical protein